MSAAVAGQDAIYAALKAYAPLTAALMPVTGDSRIYDTLAPPDTKLVKPNGAPWPYLTLSGATEGPADSFGGAGYRGALTINAWVPGAEQRAALALYALVRAALHEVPLALTGLTTLRCRVSARTQTDPDRQATQAIIAVRYVTQETT